MQDSEYAYIANRVLTNRFLSLSLLILSLLLSLYSDIIAESFLTGVIRRDGLFMVVLTMDAIIDE